jgi:hypothetical protein
MMETIIKRWSDLKEVAMAYFEGTTPVFNWKH